jgi:hypothetical protein
LDAEVRRDIEDLVARYCWGVDERRRDVVASCFTSDCSWVGRVAGERVPLGSHVGSQAVADWLASLWNGLDSQRRHAFVGLLPGRQGAESARLSASASFILVGTQAGRSEQEVTGRYAFGFDREKDGWRIRALEAIFDSPLRAVG